MTKIFLKSRYSEWVSETKPMKQTCRGEDELRQTEDEREDKDHLIPSITTATRSTCWRGRSTCTGQNLFLCVQHPINLSLLLSL